MDINEWIKDYSRSMAETFGDRIMFMGLQGSYGRGEAAANSDIDVVLILDRIDMKDLEIYDMAISRLPNRELICGFVSGWEELESWDKADLFQFCHDTKAILGSLEEIKNSIKEEDIRRAVHTGACNIYHGCVHNCLHEKSPDILKDLCKAARFVMQAKYFLKTGIYIKKRSELAEAVSAQERQILEGNAAFDTLSALLLEWSKALVHGI